jgi:hypothetical protein
MKNFTLFSLAVIAFTATVFGRDDYVLKKVSIATPTTPTYSSDYQGPTRRARAEHWLELQADFDSNAEMTDELTFKYYVLFAGKCLTGEVTHVNITKGRDLHSVMYISPKSIAQLLNGKQLTGTDVQDVGVQIESKGTVVAAKSFKGQGEWWAKLTPVPGMVINKTETPFAPLYWDSYEAVRPSSAH